jgi:hypothetical protein
MPASVRTRPWRLSRRAARRLKAGRAAGCSTADGPAHAIAGNRDPVVVAHARDRALVGAKRRAGEQQPAPRGTERARESLAPGKLLAQMVRLVGDDQGMLAALLCPARGRRGRPRVGRDDAVEVARRAQLHSIGDELDTQARRRFGPLACQRRRRADDVHPAQRSPRSAAGERTRGLGSSCPRRAPPTAGTDRRPRPTCVRGRAPAMPVGRSSDCSGSDG